MFQEYFFQDSMNEFFFLKLVNKNTNIEVLWVDIDVGLLFMIVKLT